MSVSPNLLFFTYLCCAILVRYCNSIRSAARKLSSSIGPQVKHWSSGNIPVTLPLSICALRPADYSLIFFSFLHSPLLRIALHSKSVPCLGAMSPLVGIPGEFDLLPDLPQDFVLPLPLPLHYQYIVARHIRLRVFSRRHEGTNR